MSKYSTEELQAMASVALQHKNSADDSYYMSLVVILMAITGLSFEQVEQNIIKLSKGEKV